MLGGVREIRSTVFPFREPQFLGGVVHGAGIEDARMVHDALEAVRPVAGDPVHHEPAIGSAHCAGMVAIQPSKALGSRIQTQLQVLQRLPAPVLADGIGERLPVARRAMEVDEHGRIAGTRVDLRIPAIAPVVGETRLRAAVNDERDGVLAPRLRIPRLHDIAVNRFAVCACEAELLCLAEAHVSEARGIHVR